LGSNAGKPDSELTTGDVVVAADYIVETFYLRAARSFGTRFGTLTPYVLLDWMKHPEAIRNKTYGGDNEAGFADDGEFWKPSIGMVFNPTYQVALKLDASAHKQDFNGKTEIYPEVRFDVSFAFQLLK
jgi:hypothetical protein